MPRKARKLRIVITAGAGGQAAHFLRLIMERLNLVELVALIESYDLGEAHARARIYNNAQRSAHPKDRRGVTWQRCRVFKTVEQAIDAIDFDLAIVCSRPEQHARELIAILEADKYVLAEKPPTATLEEMVEVALAELRSKGWVAWNFQLFWQWRELRKSVRRGRLGAPLVVETNWIRGLVVSADRQAAEQGVRRGQSGRPMVDLCHMVDAALCLLSRVTPMRVLGFSANHGATAYETLTATVLASWEGREIPVQLRVVCGFNIPLRGKHTLEEVLVTYQGAVGHGTVRGLVDERVIGGRPLAPEDYWPAVTAAEGPIDDQSVEDGAIRSPQPPTVYECYGLTLDWVIRMIRSGEQHRGGPHGIRVMQLLEAFARSSEVGHEVDVAAVAGIEWGGPE